MRASRTDIVVVGAGPAGAAAAIRLAEAGREVVLIDRAPGPPRKVCGEFLSAETLAALEGLGLDAFALGAAPIERVRLTAGGRSAEAALPFRAAGLRRVTLDPALQAQAVAAGAQLRLGTCVRRIESFGTGMRVTLATAAAGGTGTLQVAAGAAGTLQAAAGGGAGTIEAAAVILATGKADLPGSHRQTAWRGRDEMLGLRMPLGLSARARRRLGRAVELHVFSGGCAGLQAVDEEAATLCITLRRTAFLRVGQGSRDAGADVGGEGGRFPQLLAAIAAENPAFGAALAGAEPLAARPAAVARVPYGYLRRPGSGGGAWPVGDQIAVTASVTGDGLALALESGLAAAAALIERREKAEFETGFIRRARPQIRAAMGLQALVDRPYLHRLGLAAARLAPALIAAVARRTRLPPCASA